MNLWSPLVEKFPFCAHTTTRGGGGGSLMFVKVLFSGIEPVNGLFRQPEWQCFLNDDISRCIANRLPL